MWGLGMSEESEVRLGHENLIAYSRTTTQWASKGSFHDDGGALLFAGGSWIPVVGNGAFRTNDGVAPEALLAQADAFFARRQRGYSVKVRDNGLDDDLRVACEAHGLAAFGDPTPQMICHQRLPAPTLPDGIVLRTVRDEQGLVDFAAVNSNAYSTYGMPAEVFLDMFDRPDRMLADPDVVVVVAYQGAQPVATAMTYLSGGVASLQWVGTVETARRMKLGRAVTVWATNASFDRGSSSVTLQASAMGEPLYTQLGYETRYHYREHVRWDTPAS
jgi:Acetyltransferase (GNAT) domain